MNCQKCGKQITFEVGLRQPSLVRFECPDCQAEHRVTAPCLRSIDVAANALYVLLILSVPIVWVCLHRGYALLCLLAFPFIFFVVERSLYVYITRKGKLRLVHDGESPAEHAMRQVSGSTPTLTGPAMSRQSVLTAVLLGFCASTFCLRIQMPVCGMSMILASTGLARRSWRELALGVALGIMGDWAMALFGSALCVNGRSQLPFVVRYTPNVFWAVPHYDSLPFGWQFRALSAFGVWLACAGLIFCLLESHYSRLRGVRPVTFAAWLAVFLCFYRGLWFARVTGTFELWLQPDWMYECACAGLWVLLPMAFGALAMLHRPHSSPGPAAPAGRH